MCEAIKSGKPNAQRELLLWFSQKYEENPDFGNIKHLVKPTFAALENRNADVRKAAQAVFPVCTSCVRRELTDSFVAYRGRCGC